MSALILAGVLSTGATAPPMFNPTARTEVLACDRLGAERYDRDRLAKAVTREEIDVPAAIEQCEADLKKWPGDGRITFHLARLYQYTGNTAKAAEYRAASAAAGYPSGIFLVGYFEMRVAKDQATLCHAASQIKLSADRGNYSGAIVYTTAALEGRFAACPGIATSAELKEYLKLARPAADGFFETLLDDHLQFELKAAGEKGSSGSGTEAAHP